MHPKFFCFLIILEVRGGEGTPRAERSHNLHVLKIYVSQTSHRPEEQPFSAVTFFLISPVNKYSEGYSFNLHGWCQKGLKVTNHVSLNLKPLNSISLIDCQSKCASELEVSFKLNVIISEWLQARVMLQSR